MKIITKPQFYSKKNIKAYEAKYNAKYVCELCVKGKNTTWVDLPSLIFYTEEPYKGSHYFAITETLHDIIISDASFVTDLRIAGVVDQKNNVIYSRYRHDFRTSPDKTISVDGGLDYLKVVGTPKKFVTLMFVKENLICMTK